MNDASTNISSVVSELTPRGRGAICVLRAQSPRVLEVINKFFIAAAGQTVTIQDQDVPIYGQWRGQHAADNAEEVILWIRDDATVEIHCHGGDFAKRRVLADLQRTGFEATPWRTAHSSTDSAAAAVAALVEATTTKTAAVLLDQARHALDRAVESIQTAIQHGDQQRAVEQIDDLMSWSHLGLHLVQPWRVVVAGRPNVGKSSLINRILGFNRSLVFDVPGTTRDVLSWQTAVDGWPVELIDTAGLHEARSDVERSGVERAKQQLALADLIVLLVDVATPVADAQSQLASISRSSQRVILPVVNKCDVAAPMVDEEDWLSISAKTGQAVDQLLRNISRLLVPCAPQPNQAVPFLDEQIQRLSNARQCLLDDNLRGAAALLAPLVSHPS